MRTRLFLAVSLSSLLVHRTALAQEPPPAPAPEHEEHEANEENEEEDENEYTNKGSWEVGGSASLTWQNDVLTISLSPTLGYFILEDLEVSGILTYTYVRVEDPAGGHTSTKTGTFVVEPSYHYPLNECMHVFGGLGVGLGYDGTDWNFDLVPRAGMNFEIGDSAVFTPAVKLPIVIGDETDVGVVVEAGFTTSF